MAEMLAATAIMFIVAGPMLLLANRFKLPAPPLLIAAGLFAGAFIEELLVLELAQFGIALIVFAFGVGINLTAIEPIIADGELAALLQITVLGSLGFGFGLLVGVPAGEAIYLGVAAALSSTMIGTALLQTEISRDLVHGRLGQSIQFVQDLAAIAFILVLGAGVLAADPIAAQLGYGAVFLIAAFLVNRHLFPVLGRLADGSVELMLVGVIAMLVLFIGAASVAGIPVVVGAFAAGLAVRHDRTEHLGLFNGLESLKDFFLAIFFVTVGALVVLPFVHLPPAESMSKLLLVVGLVVLTVVVKPAVTTAILIYRGYEARTATITALSVDQVSEFALIIAIYALMIEAVGETVFDAIILAAAVTMITSTVTHRYNEDIYRWLADRGVIRGRHDKIDELSHVPEGRTDHVIILGYGRKGRRVVEVCEELGVPYLVIENDPAIREQVMVECAAYVFGDAMEAYSWEKANVEAARLIVSVTGSRAVSERVLEFGFDADLILRAEEEADALDLLDAGATYVAVPDLLAGEQLVKNVRALLEGDVAPETLRADGIADLREEQESSLFRRGAPGVESSREDRSPR